MQPTSTFKKTAIVAAIILVSSTCAFGASTFKVFLKNGRIISSDEVIKEEKTVIIVTTDGRLEIDKSQIRQITEIVLSDEENPPTKPAEDPLLAEEVAPEAPPEQPVVALDENGNPIPPAPPADDEQPPTTLVPPVNPDLTQPPQTSDVQPPVNPEDDVPTVAKTKPPVPLPELANKTKNQQRIDELLQSLAVEENATVNFKELSQLAETNIKYLTEITMKEIEDYAYWSAYALSELKFDAIGEFFLKLMDHSSPKVRIIAVSKLMYWNDNPSVVAAVKQNFLKEKETSVRITYIAAIRQLKIYDCVSDLFNCLKGAEENITIQARTSIISLAQKATNQTDAETMQMAIRENLLTAPDDDYLMQVIRLVGDMENPVFVETVSSFLDSPNEDILYETVDAIGKMKDINYAQRLMDFYEVQKSDRLRAIAIKSLEKIGDIRTVRFLLDGLQANIGPDASQPVRSAFRNALETITGQKKFKYDMEQWNQWWEKTTAPQEIAPPETSE